MSAEGEQYFSKKFLSLNMVQLLSEKITKKVRCSGGPIPLGHVILHMAAFILTKSHLYKLNGLLEIYK